MSHPRTPISPSQAHQLSTETRNDIYSLLLSGTGILNIESSLIHELQRSGWLDNLKAYMTQLLRSGEATTHGELMAKVKEKIEADRGRGKASGQTNGAMTNGINGFDAHEEDLNLSIPRAAITEGTKTVRRELEKVCEMQT